MKKGLCTLILIISIVTTLSNSVLAYTPAIRTNVGATLEAEPNDCMEDATILWKNSLNHYVCQGAMAYMDDDDYFVYQCNTTQTRNLNINIVTPIRVGDAKIYITLFDATTNQYMYANSNSVYNSYSADIKTFNAIAGHDYIVYAGLEGARDLIQERLDYLVEHTTRNQGFTYNISIN